MDAPVWRSEARLQTLLIAEGDLSDASLANWKPESLARSWRSCPYRSQFASASAAPAGAWEHTQQDGRVPQLLRQRTPHYDRIVRPVEYWPLGINEMQDSTARVSDRF